MPSHRVLVTVQAQDLSLWERGKLVDYDGPADWKFEPLDPLERQVWEAETALPDRVEIENRRHNVGGCFEEGKSLPPEGMWIKHSKALVPSSGWQG